MASHAYNLRRSRSRNYRELSNVNLPRSARITQKDKLYPVEVVERAGSRVKIHYIGYDDSSDEWREVSDIITSHADPGNSNRNIAQLHPYSLYQELAIKIKQALTCGRKQSPLWALIACCLEVAFKWLELQQGVYKEVNGIQLNVTLILIPFWDTIGITEESIHMETMLTLH